MTNCMYVCRRDARGGSYGRKMKNEKMRFDESGHGGLRSRSFFCWLAYGFDM